MLRYDFIFEISGGGGGGGNIDRHKNNKNSAKWNASN